MSAAILLALFILLPASVFAFLPTRARRYFLAAAFAAFVAAHFLLGPVSSDGQILMLPLALLGIVLGGLLVEAVVLVRRLFTKGQIASHG